MCDTVFAGPDVTRNGEMLFGKNSDRQRNEAQAVELHRGADYPADASVRCTHITIPQVRSTSAVLICRPFWMWGAEMGANEHGLVIGNEGLRARSPSPEKPALTGMDLLRLTLERASSAAQAIDVLTTLLETHGQGGDCGYLKPSYYNNGYIIADAREGFVLETIDRDWLVRRISGTHAISNAYSINRPTRCSANLLERIRSEGWDESPPADFTAAIGDPESQHIGRSEDRRARAIERMSAGANKVDAAGMMRVLRDHGAEAPDQQDWPRSQNGFSICMHARGTKRPAQTTGSLVSEVTRDRAIHWVTATAAPCLSLFKPVVFGSDVPPMGPPLTGCFDERTLWWSHERLHRSALTGSLLQFVDAIAEERDVLEAEFRAHIDEVLTQNDRQAVPNAVATCWRRAEEAVHRWQALVRTRASQGDRYDLAWAEMNEQAGVDLQLRFREPVQG